MKKLMFIMLLFVSVSSTASIGEEIEWTEKQLNLGNCLQQKIPGADKVEIANIFVNVHLVKYRYKMYPVDIFYIDTDISKPCLKEKALLSKRDAKQMLQFLGDKWSMVLKVQQDGQRDNVRRWPR